MFLKWEGVFHNIYTAKLEALFIIILLCDSHAEYRTLLEPRKIFVKHCLDQCIYIKTYVALNFHMSTLLSLDHEVFIFISLDNYRPLVFLFCVSICLCED